MTSQPPEQEGRLAPTSPGAITAWAVVGLIGGWLVRRVMEYADRPAPMVTWTQSFALLFAAAILLGVAWLTRRAVRSATDQVEAHRMVNRLVLARATVLVGALLAGAYAGYALSWVGVASQLRTERIVRALAASAGGTLVAGASMLLERACRVRSDDESA